MQMGMPQPMKNPITAPSRDRIMLTSMASMAIIAENIKQNHVNLLNIQSLALGFAANVINSCLVKKIIIGNTEKFWNKIPAWTIFPSAQKTQSSEVLVELTQSKTVEQCSGLASIFLTSGAQESPPINPTQKHILAPRTYPQKRSLLLFNKLIFLLRMGAAMGCTRNDRAKAPATLEKSALKSLKSVKWIFPSLMCRIKLRSMKIAQAIMQYIEQLISLRMKSSYFWNRICFKTKKVMIADHCKEYLERTIQCEPGGSQGSNPFNIAEVISQKLWLMSIKYATQTKKNSSILTTLLILSALTPPILKMDQLQVASSGLL